MWDNCQHERTPLNTTYKNGYPYCKACMRVQEQERRDRKKKRLAELEAENARLKRELAACLNARHA